MRVLHPKDTAAAEHHLILRQSSCLVGEQVLDLTQVLSDVEGPALDPGVQLLVVKGQVVVDEVDLAQFHDLDGHVQRNGDQHLKRGQSHRFLFPPFVPVSGRLLCFINVFFTSLFIICKTS